MHDKMLDLVIQVNGEGAFPVLLAVGLIVLFAAVVALVLKHK